LVIKTKTRIIYRLYARSPPPRISLPEVSVRPGKSGSGLNK